MPSSQARRNRRQIEQLAAAGSPIAISALDFTNTANRSEDGRRFQQYYEYYGARVLGEALTRVKWEGLPDTISARYLELVLFTRGSATITHVGFEPRAQQAAPTGLWDSQQDYLEWASIGAVGNYEPARNTRNSVMVWDNDARFITASIAQTLVSDLAQALLTASSNLRQQQTAVFFTATRSNIDDARKLARSFGLGETGSVMYEELVGTLGVNVINPNVPDHTTTAFKARTEYMNEIHALLGTDYVPHEKESGLQPHEAKVGSDSIYRQRRLFLEPRERAADQMNKLFGWDVSVSWNDFDPLNDISSASDLPDVADAKEADVGLRTV